MEAKSETPIFDRVGLRSKEAASHAAFLTAPPLNGRYEFLVEIRGRRVRSRFFHVDNHITGSPYEILVVAKYFA